MLVIKVGFKFYIADGVMKYCKHHNTRRKAGNPEFSIIIWVLCLSCFYGFL